MRKVTNPETTMITSCIAACLAVIAGTAVATPADAPSLAVGTSFPDLVLPSLDGTSRSIRDFRGRKVVLHVFASW